MNKRKVAVGPGASSLILIAVVLSLSVLTVLTMISARNDEALARRSAETRQQVYALFARGEESLAKLDGALAACLAENPESPEAYLAAVKQRLPEGMKMKDDQVSWTEQADDRTLECAVRILPPGAEGRTRWTLHRLGAGDIWEEDDWGEESWDAEEDEADLTEEDGETDAESEEAETEAKSEESEAPEAGEGPEEE